MALGKSLHPSDSRTVVFLGTRLISSQVPLWFIHAESGVDLVLEFKSLSVSVRIKEVSDANSMTDI